MLFNLYLLTTGASIATDAITLVDLIKRLKEDGYVINNGNGKEEKTKEETLKNLIITLSTIALPGYNAYFSYKFHSMTDEQYEILKNILIEKNLIRRATWKDLYEESYSFDVTPKEVMDALKELVAQKLAEGYSVLNDKVEETTASIKEDENFQKALNAINAKKEDLLNKKERIKNAIKQAIEEEEARRESDNFDDLSDDKGPKKK